jgi:hypothetical protein
MLDTESSQLEAAVHHALEHLAKDATAHNLERVLKIKARMVRLTAKVTTVSRPSSRTLGSHDMTLLSPCCCPCPRALGLPSAATIHMCNQSPPEQCCLTILTLFQGNHHRIS